MSKYRIWKLGSLEYRIYPTQDAVDNLRRVLEATPPNTEDVVDIIWGPDLEVLELGDDDETIEEYVVEEVREDGDEINIRARRVNATGTSKDTGDKGDD